MRMSYYFPGLYEYSSENVKVELDLFHHATKARLKGAPGVDTLKLAAQAALANLKAQVD